MRKILILSLAGAVVLAGALVAVARMGDSGEPSKQEPAPTPSASPEPSPQPSVIPPAAPLASTPVVPPKPPPPAAASPAAPPAAPVPPPVFPDPPGYQPTVVTPRPGMDNVHRVTFRRAEVLNDRTVRVHYESGVAPCSVLDRVEVDYRSTEIAISLFEGSDPAFKDAACIMIAQFKAVDVALNQPVNGRAIVEGNR